jgi:hypothetical protein
MAPPDHRVRGQAARFASVGVTGAGIHFLSQATEMSVFVTNVASMIGIGMAVDNSLFVLARCGEEVRRARGRRRPGGSRWYWVSSRGASARRGGTQGRPRGTRARGVLGALDGASDAPALGVRDRLRRGAAHTGRPRALARVRRRRPAPVPRWERDACGRRAGRPGARRRRLWADPDRGPARPGPRDRRLHAPGCGGRGRAEALARRPGGPDRGGAAARSREPAGAGAPRSAARRRDLRAVEGGQQSRIRELYGERAARASTRSHSRQPATPAPPWPRACARARARSRAPR